MFEDSVSVLSGIDLGAGIASWYSDGPMLHVQGMRVDTRQDQEVFLFIASRPGLWPVQLPI
jgi:hypothetical protein